MYVRSKTDKLQFLQADEERYWHSWQVLTGGEFVGEEKECFELGEAPRNSKVSVDRIAMDDWLEFLGYYISEGCVRVRKRVREVNGRDYDMADYNVLVAQVNPEGRAHISSCLDRLGFKYFDSDDHQFRICSKQLTEILQPLGKSGDKYIPREYLNLDRRQSLILFKALILGDGSQREDCYTYYTKSKQLADDVQELAMRCGYAATVVSHAVGRDLYRVNIRPAKDANLVEPKKIPYKGNVYCVNVKNHVVCVRRNGRAAFCGNCYDEGKRIAETLAFDYHRENKVDIRVMRIFNTYGSRMLENDGRVVSNFIVQALRGEPITIYGDGSQTRSFCYVSDLVEGMMRLMNQDFIGPVNIGNPGEYTILQLAQTIQKMVNPGAELIYKPLPADDPKQRQPDITRAKTYLGWEPTIPLKEGLKLTIDDFRSRIEGES
jgi:UDP-glucuronate decarboxylase